MPATFQPPPYIYYNKAAKGMQQTEEQEYFMRLYERRFRNLITPIGSSFL